MMRICDFRLVDHAWGGGGGGGGYNLTVSLACAGQQRAQQARCAWPLQQPVTPPQCDDRLQVSLVICSALLTHGSTYDFPELHMSERLQHAAHVRGTLGSSSLLHVILHVRTLQNMALCVTGSKHAGLSCAWWEAGDWET